MNAIATAPIFSMYQSALHLANELINILPTAEYDAERYPNGTGYHNTLAMEECHAPCTMVDNYGRRLIVIPQEGGLNLVVFQRYTDNDQQWCYHAPFSIIGREGRDDTFTSAHLREDTAFIIAAMYQCLLNERAK